jgi:hypothetical protein
MSERASTIEAARAKARNMIEDDLGLGNAVALFYAELNGRIDPPIHHADFTQGILLAENRDEAGVRKWLEKF